MQCSLRISHAVYHIIMHRYAQSPGFEEIQQSANALMANLGYDIYNTDIDYRQRKAASLGNFLALEIIKFGLLDGANEQHDYENQFYQPINPALPPFLDYVNEIKDPNRWQPLLFNEFIDQSGNFLPEAIPAFLSPEWGDVRPFSLENADYTNFITDNHTYRVALDPGAPPMLHQDDADYQWGFTMVSHWGAHLDPSDGVMWDISPNAIGNIQHYTEEIADYPEFYVAEGGGIGKGYPANPVTSKPYTPQIVPRGDYARVLAEFWADGPDSETPPGHWYVILNYVMDHPSFTYQFGPTGELLDPLAYDVKAYFLLGGAMHDAAISAWSIKGRYDYIRPVSAIRYMADLGQSSHPNELNYHPQGIPLQKGLVELIQAGDVDFPDPKLIGKIKVKSWKGHEYIDDPATDQAGVGWILAEKWSPYQRPSFVTPPFAGYVSGHSTFSRAAAEVLTHITGSPYFPNGMGEFIAKKNEFLVFEEGPSQDIILQWASYQDAADQCSLSRIWGGIHPPADDLPGRKIGSIIGKKAIRKANLYFNGTPPLPFQTIEQPKFLLYPNPAINGQAVQIEAGFDYNQLTVTNMQQQIVHQQTFDFPYLNFTSSSLNRGIYIVTLSGDRVSSSQKLIIIR